MSNSSLVSVIIPAYNAQQFIRETIFSVLEQTWKELEVIIVNDGSTDSTEDIVRSFADDNRVKYMSQSNNGCSAAKNTGLEAATGSFIQFLDADDLLSPNKIEEQVRALMDEPLKVAVCKTKVFEFDHRSPNLQEVNTEMLYDSSSPKEFLLNLYGLNGKKGMVQPNAFLISRQLANRAGPYDCSISPSPDEDGEYFCRVILNASAITYTPEGVNYYRKIGKSSSLSAQHSSIHVRGALRSLELKAKHLLAAEDSERVRNIIAGGYADFIYLYYGHFKELCLQAENNIHALGIKQIQAGGTKFKLISRLIGFKTALQLRQSLQKL